MARRKSKSHTVFSAFTDGADFFWECQQVIALRLMRIAGGGGPARRETRRMFAEKAVAAATAQFAAAAVLPVQGLVGAADAASTVYRRALRANRRRLTPRNSRR